MIDSEEENSEFKSKKRINRGMSFGDASDPSDRLHDVLSSKLLTKESELNKYKGNY